jgi:hypothetical protein
MAVNFPCRCQGISRGARYRGVRIAHLTAVWRQQSLIFFASAFEKSVTAVQAGVRRVVKNQSPSSLRWLPFIVDCPCDCPEPVRSHSRNRWSRQMMSVDGKFSALTTV